MAELGELLCCLTPEDCQVAPPERRDDCGPCIWTSGIVSFNSQYQELADSKYKSANLNFRRPLPLTYPTGPVMCVDPETGMNANDVAPDPCACDSVCNGSMSVAKQLGTHCWQVNDIEEYCDTIRSGRMDFIMDHMMSEFWIRALYENQIMGMLKGITANNLANEDGDMVVNIVEKPSPTLDGSGETTLMNSIGHTRALKSMGCTNSSIDGIIMHECVWFNLLSSEAHCCNHADVFPSEQIGRSPMMRAGAGSGMAMHFYQGKPVYVCDHACLVEEDAEGNTIYKTYYFGRGLFGFAEGNPEAQNFPMISTDRDECANNGMGAQKIFARKVWVLHPNGYSNKWNAGCGDGTLRSDYSMMTELETANPIYWQRETGRKNIPLVIVCSNG